MSDDRANALMLEFRRQREQYLAFTKKLESLLEELLKPHKQRLHSVTSRCKEEKSLLDKLSQSQGKYTKLSDVVDLCGIRIITYFQDDVNVISRIIEEQFSIDLAHSIDKQQLLAPEAFGYLSLHYVVGLNAARANLPEYRDFAGLKAEIQIRSILQHAWAEIEHDLGYKIKESIPAEIERRFSRLAGLLEIADNEFIELRKDLTDYRQYVQKRMQSEPQSVLINQVSLQVLVDTDQSIRELEDKIGASIKTRIVRKATWASGAIAKGLNALDLNNIAELHQAIRKWQHIIPKFSARYLGIGREEIFAGVSLWMLTLVLVGQTGSIRKIANFLKVYRYDTATRRKMSQSVLMSYKAAVAHK